MSQYATEWRKETLADLVEYWAKDYRFKDGSVMLGYEYYYDVLTGKVLIELHLQTGEKKGKRKKAR